MSAHQFGLTIMNLEAGAVWSGAQSDDPANDSPKKGRLAAGFPAIGEIMRAEPGC
jgi:hypothetical protein